MTFNSSYDYESVRQAVIALARTLPDNFEAVPNVAYMHNDSGSGLQRLAQFGNRHELVWRIWFSAADAEAKQERIGAIYAAKANGEVAVENLDTIFDKIEEEVGFGYEDYELRGPVHIEGDLEQMKRDLAMLVLADFAPGPISRSFQDCVDDPTRRE